MTTTPITGPAGPSAPDIDWVAYGALQDRRYVRHDSFGCRCLDEAETRLLAGKNYKNSGTKLAKSLERDCRKSTRLRRTQIIWQGDDPDLTPAELDLRSDGSLRLLAEDLNSAAETVGDFVRSLPVRLRLALESEVCGRSKGECAARTGVAQRQYRNVFAATLAKFRGRPEVMEALRLLRASGPKGIRCFRDALEQLEEQVLAA